MSEESAVEATVIPGATDAEAMALASGVMETIVSIAVKDLEGVTGLGATGRRKLFGAKSAEAPVEVAMEDGQAVVAVHLSVAYGQVLPEVAAAVRKAVADALASQVGVGVKSIDIYVDAITF